MVQVISSGIQEDHYESSEEENKANVREVMKEYDHAQENMVIDDEPLVTQEDLVAESQSMLIEEPQCFKEAQDADSPIMVE